MVYDRKQEFIDKYIKASPEFDKYSFEHRDTLPTNKSLQREQLREAAETIQRKINPTGVKCPTCQSPNIQKNWWLGTWYIGCRMGTV